MDVQTRRVDTIPFGVRFKMADIQLNLKLALIQDGGCLRQVRI
jgi:hypothetical protein